MSVRVPPELVLRILWPMVLPFLGTLRRVIDETGAPTPSSWWRSPDANASVGGGPESQHLVGLAVDFPLEPGALATRLLETARRHGVVAIDETRGARPHVHVQAFPANGKPPDVLMATWLVRWIF